MPIAVKISSFFTAAYLLIAPAQADVCESMSGGVSAVGSTVAVASTAVAEFFGVAAVTHSSGAAILTSVGAGGTGYLAGTLGTIGAAALSIVSSPAVIVTAVGVAVVGGGTATYCYIAD